MARIVFEDAFGIKNILGEGLLSEDQVAELQSIIKRIEEGEPLQYILENAHFYGLDLFVDERVLIPRPETEELVYWILQDHKKEKFLKVLDIGTGSGCIPLSLKKERPDWVISALDASEGALEVAAKNAHKLDLHIHFLHLDFLDRDTWTSLPFFDLIVSNPPYIPRKEMGLMPSNVVRYEPDMALFVANEQPLIFYERIARFGQDKLSSNGAIYVELNEYNAGEVRAVFEKAGYTEVVVQKDMQGKARMLRAS